LLKHGANPNATWVGRTTALMEAAKEDHYEVCKLLLAAGADVNAEEPTGATALMYALNPFRTNLKTVQLLLSKGARVTINKGRGYQPVMRAAETGDPEILNLLLAVGADPKVKSEDGHTAL